MFQYDKFSNHFMLKLIQEGEKYLESPTLVEFYIYLNNKVEHEKVHPCYVGEITAWLEETCEIDTVNALGDAIPPYYLYGVDFVPDGLKDGWTLKFPPKIKTIGPGAFSYNYDFDSIDLGNIEYVGKEAFDETAVTKIYISRFNTDFGRDAIDITHLSKVYFKGIQPSNLDAAKYIFCRNALGDTECEYVDFEIY